MKNHTAIIGWWIVALCLAAAAYIFCAVRWLPVATFESAQLLPQAKPFPKLALQNQYGHLFFKENFNGHWSLVFFGFTSCPDVCPLTLQTLSQIVRRAEQQQQIIQVVFISVDPERDSPTKIATYLAAFHPSIVGLSGADTELTLLNHFFAVNYARRAPLAESSLAIPAADISQHPEHSYQVEHSGRIFIVDPQGQYIGSFPPPHTGGILWADLQLILKR